MPKLPINPMIFRKAIQTLNAGKTPLATSNNLGQLLKQKITWDPAPPEKISEDIIAKKGNYLIKLGDFPAEPFYILLKDGKPIRELTILPKNWTLPDEVFLPTPKPKD
jgi:hypothetical protein